MSLLVVENLVRTYEEGGFRFGPASVEFSPGETVALVGKNGAGKTTFFQMITGNVDPDEGVIMLGDEAMTPDKPHLKRKIGYLPQHHTLPAWVTGRELIAYASKLHSIPDPPLRTEATLKRWGAEEYAHKPIAACSHGMQKRIGLGLATLHDPDLLILDEPFSGLDLTHIRNLDLLIRKRRAAGQVTVLSSHITPYCARLADRVLLIEAGRIRVLAGWSELDELARAIAIEDAFFAGEPEC